MQPGEVLGGEDAGPAPADAAAVSVVLVHSLHNPRLLKTKTLFHSVFADQNVAVLRGAKLPVLGLCLDFVEEVA